MWYRLTVRADIVDIKKYLEAFPDLEGNADVIWSRKEREIILSKWGHNHRFYKKALAIINKVCNIKLLGSAKYHLIIRWDNDADIYLKWRSLGEIDIDLISYHHAEQELSIILKELQ